MSHRAGLSWRELIAYHEAGHAAVGHHQGLTFGRIYLGDVGGQVQFDPQWGADEVLQDAELFGRYALMLLAPACVEQRCLGRVVGAASDIDTLDRMLEAAGPRISTLRSDFWVRADREVAEHWSGIRAVAAELAHHATPVSDLAHVLAAYPELGSSVSELTAARALTALARSERPVPRPTTPRTRVRL